MNAIQQARISTRARRPGPSRARGAGVHPPPRLLALLRHVAHAPDVHRESVLLPGFCAPGSGNAGTPAAESARRYAVIMEGVPAGLVSSLAVRAEAFELRAIGGLDHVRRIDADSAHRALELLGESIHARTIPDARGTLRSFMPRFQWPGRAPVAQITRVASNRFSVRPATNVRSTRCHLRGGLVLLYSGLGK